MGDERSPHPCEEQLAPGEAPKPWLVYQPPHSAALSKLTSRRIRALYRPKWGTDAVYKVLDNPRVIQAHIQCQRSYEMVDVLGLVDDVVGREQLIIAREDWIKNSSSDEARPQVLIQGSVKTVVMQTTSGGESSLLLDERKGDGMPRTVSTVPVKPRSAWANGSFYLFVFVIVVAAMGLLAKTVPWYVLPLTLIAGVIFVPLVGALQLRMDERLSQKSFLELMKLVIGQLPLLRQIAKKLDE